MHASFAQVARMGYGSRAIALLSKCAPPPPLHRAFFFNFLHPLPRFCE